MNEIPGIVTAMIVVLVIVRPFLRVAPIASPPKRLTWAPSRT